MKPHESDPLPPPMAPLRAMSLIKALAESAQALSLTQLSTRMDIPKSSLVNLLRAMLEGGYVAAQGKLYVLGPETYRISTLVGKTNRFPANVHQLLDRLRDLTDETCLIGVPDESWTSFVYADILESSNSLRFSPKSGEKRLMHKAAAGKVLLAFSQPDQRDGFLDHLRKLAPAPLNAMEVKDLVRELDSVRAAGFAVSNISIPGVTAIMAPVFDGRSAILAAVGLAGPSERITGRQQDYVEMVVEAARGMSALQA